MKEGYVIRDQKLLHFITATVVNWVDVLQEKRPQGRETFTVRFAIKENFAERIFKNRNNGFSLVGILVKTDGHVYI